MHDVDAIVALLTDDVWLRMPPLPFEYHGHAAAAEFLAALRPLALPGRPMRLLPTRANGQPALGGYRFDPAAGAYRSSGVYVLTLAGERISEVSHFDPPVARYFGLSDMLPG